MKKKSHKTLKLLLILLIPIAAIALDQTEREDIIQDCLTISGDDAIYLRDFDITLPEADSGQRAPIYRQAIILRSKNIYRFTLCSQQGQAILRLYDSNNLLLSTLDPQSDQVFNPINFLCNKTGQYNIMISFRDGLAGQAVGVMSHVSK